jgi:NRPS condensation-like uncharacterized protein
MNWPLPLTPIEELLFVDDRPANPCCCFLRADFSGCFERATLEGAIHATLRQHPLLSARVARRGRRLVWVPVEDQKPVIEWMSKPTGDGLPRATRIDLSEEVGIRFQVLMDDAASALILQFHHAVCDGAGIFRILHDLLIEYATAHGQPRGKVTMSSLDPGLLARRGKFGLTIARRLAMAPRQIMNLWEARRLVGRIPAPLLPHPPAPHHQSVPSEYPAAISARLTSAETAALRPTARKNGMTVNDLILTDTFLACHEWRQLHTDQRSGQWLRIAVPVNLRTAQDRHLPAANIVSMVFLDRCGADFDDPSTLRRGLHHEMNHHKQRQMGFTFSLATALGRRLPGGLKKHLWANKCLTSSVLTNLGTVFLRSPLRDSSGRLVAGGVTLESLDTLPPLRPHMAAGFAVGIYAGQMWITLHFDPRPLTQSQARDLMGIFLRRIRSSIDSLR